MCHVLIVDDNALSRRLTRAWLQRLGQHVEEAVDGASALRRLGIGEAAPTGGEVPAVVLLDMVLPDTDGWALLHAIRADRRFDGVKVYCYSGTVDAGTELPGFDGTIAKSGSHQRFVERFGALAACTSPSRNGACGRKRVYGDAPF